MKLCLLRTALILATAPLLSLSACKHSAPEAEHTTGAPPAGKEKHTKGHKKAEKKDEKKKGDGKPKGKKAAKSPTAAPTPGQ